MPRHSALKRHDALLPGAPIPWIWDLRFMARENRPLFIRLIDLPPDELDANLQMFLKRGWVERRSDGFIITAAGRDAARLA